MKCPAPTLLSVLLLSTEISFRAQAQRNLAPLNRQLETCKQAFDEEACTNGYYQEYTRIVQHCLDGPPRLDARTTQEACQRNEMGLHCGSFDTFFLLDSIPYGLCESGCSPECRDLLISTRNKLGCCVTILNGTTFLAEHAPFEYHLWSACGVEPVTQECPPSSISLQPPIQRDPTCNDSVLSDHFLSHACRRQYIQPIQDRLVTEGCQNESFTYSRARGRCIVNKFGQYCNSLHQGSFKYTAATRNCRDISTCDPLCIETLSNIADTLGCCFNEQYNTTDVDWLSYEFYSMCGLEPLGSCELRLNDDAPFGIVDDGMDDNEMENDRMDGNGMDDTEIDDAERVDADVNDASVRLQSSVIIACVALILTKQ